MKTSHWIFIILSVILFSCKKYSARKLAGHYDGTARVYDEKPLEPVIDYTVPAEFVVTRHKHYIDVLNQVIHEDSLEDGYYEYVNPLGTWGINFVEVKDDSMILRIYETHKFGYIKFTEYRGLKRKE